MSLQILNNKCSFVSFCFGIKLCVWKVLVISIALQIVAWVSFTSLLRLVEFTFVLDSIPHVPNVLVFEDFLNLAMLLNYAELVLVVTPWRYDSPCLVSFQQPIYQLPRQCSRELRAWLTKNFKLTLEPPGGADGYTDEDRLPALMTKFLHGQACTLWRSIRNRDKLGVVGAISSRHGKENEITPGQVLAAIQSDLSDFPGFSLQPRDLVKPPSTYCWPAAPGASRFALKLKTLR